MPNQIEDIIIKLAEKMTASNANEDLKNRIKGLVARNDLSENKAVPQWLITLLTQVEQGKTTSWQPFPTTDYNYAAVFTFLAELDEVLPINYSHLEEQIELTFAPLGIKAVISVESNHYQITKI